MILSCVFGVEPDLPSSGVVRVEPLTWAEPPSLAKDKIRQRDPSKAPKVDSDRAAQGRYDGAWPFAPSVVERVWVFREMERQIAPRRVSVCLWHRSKGLHIWLRHME